MRAINERRGMRGQGGFTLIELLVVIAILGILAGVVVFAVGGVQSTAQKKACEIEGKSVETAAQAFRADQTTPAYPSTLAQLAPSYMKTSAKLILNWSAASLGTQGEVSGIGNCLGVNPD